MDRKLVAILVAGAIVIGTTAWRTYNARPAEVAKEDRRYMHCPNCNREMRYDERRYEQDCMNCGQKGPLVATKASLRETGVPPGPVARMLPPILIEGTLLAAVVFWYASRRQRLSPETDDLYMECVHCNQRLRYKVAKTGQLGQCPRCKRRFVFPPAAADGAETPWWRPQWCRPQWWRSRDWWKKSKIKA